MTFQSDPVIISQSPAPPLPPWEVVPPQVIVIITIAVVTGAVLILWPLVRALARRIEGRGGAAVQRELEELRTRLDAAEQRALSSGELDAAEQRMYELEERVEFMERVVTRGKEEARGGA